MAILPNLTLIPIDFDNESLLVKLDEAGFHKNCRSLFILEGLLMYLQRNSVDGTFRIIRDYAMKGSWLVFDYIYASVLRKERIYYGETGIVQTVFGAGEQWHFGIEKGLVEGFLDKYDMQLMDHKDSNDLEQTYFRDSYGRIIGRVNGTHCLVTAEKR